MYGRVGEDIVFLILLLLIFFFQSINLVTKNFLATKILTTLSFRRHDNFAKDKIHFFDKINFFLKIEIIELCLI